ncbi:Uncharacterised protein [Serratia quinivorans]|nr:Uncharacterised protein [Serratia quinivorans]CAI1111952.1 Uncharacterised protein [Serratia quinivorans]CAI1162629.1 Uncharacterised protein [Serratia quinivorans]CAI1821243.1 Uncharacterised protein [Serratia quinivorans]CAI2142311.1 Uncharacterised protein [Serratia quinivorans]
MIDFRCVGKSNTFLFILTGLDYFGIILVRQSAAVIKYFTFILSE